MNKKEIQIQYKKKIRLLIRYNKNYKKNKIKDIKKENNSILKKFKSLFSWDE